MGVADFFFPKRCVGCERLGSYLCTVCFTKIEFSTSTLCFVCNRGSLDGLTHPSCRGKFVIDGVYSSLVYSGIVKKLVYLFKYQPYLTDLKTVLIDLMYESLSQQEMAYKVLSSEGVLVPIPLEKGKLRRRGYNQASILAKGLAKKGFAPQDREQETKVEDILMRVKKTKSQFELNREQRKENIRDAFVVTDSFDPVTSPPVILIDDLVTSGATLLEAAKVLKKSGVESVYGIALAHGQ